MKHLAYHYYHVYNRGVAKQNIFVNDKIYQFLLEKIDLFLPKYELSIIAYCLMPNHYHFLLRPEADNQISPFIQRLFNSYTQAFNRQQNRSGTLFESRAKSKHVDTDEYALYLTRYIHLNPVEAGLVQSPEQWPHSSFGEWAGIRSSNLFDSQFAKGFFPDLADYVSFVSSKISPRFERKLPIYFLD